MSRSFNGSNQSLSTGSAAISGTPPYTFACWYRPASLAGLAFVFGLDDGASTYRTIAMDTSGKGGIWYDGAAALVSASTATVSTNTWAHLAYVETTTTSRNAYLNGVAATADTTSKAAIVSTRTNIGMQVSADFSNGLIAECGAWNVALTANEIAALAAGMSPLLVRPDALVGYWPLWGDDSPEPDWCPAGTHRSATLANAPTKGTTNPPVTSFLEPYWAMNLSQGIVIVPVTKALAGTLTLSGVPSFQRTRVKALSGILQLVGAVTPAFLFRKLMRTRYTIGLDPERITTRL